ncbi:hypothetical protein [Tolypothrix sp. VBCCA 56010]|uniref:hypothetical protein n=1 Tax=Tolypothrix sp. VBCCA 56010 TaxID=3137731 RepID=UPI003D7D8F85
MGNGESGGTRRQGDKGTRRQGDKGTRGQGDNENNYFPPLPIPHYPFPIAQCPIPNYQIIVS